MSKWPVCPASKAGSAKWGPEQSGRKEPSIACTRRRPTDRPVRLKKKENADRLAWNGEDEGRDTSTLLTKLVWPDGLHFQFPYSLNLLTKSQMIYFHESASGDFSTQQKTLSN